MPRRCAPSWEPLAAHHDAAGERLVGVLGTADRPSTNTSAANDVTTTERTFIVLDP